VFNKIKIHSKNSHNIEFNWVFRYYSRRPVLFIAQEEAEAHPVVWSADILAKMMSAHSCCYKNLFYCKFLLFEISFERFFIGFENFDFFFAI